MKIKGQNLRLLVGGKYIAAATSCTLHVSMKLEDSSTKDSTDDWQEQEITGKSWDISTEALYTVPGTSEADANGSSAEDILDLILAAKEVEIEFQRTAGEKNRVPVDAAKVYSGKALPNDISIKASNRQNGTFTFQAQGNGPLAPKAGK